MYNGIRIPRLVPRHFRCRGVLVRLYHLPKKGFPLAIFHETGKTVTSRVVRTLSDGEKVFAQTETGAVYDFEELI